MAIAQRGGRMRGVKRAHSQPRARIERQRNRAAATGVCAQGTKWRAHSRRKKRKKAHFCSVLRGRVIKMAGGGADVCVVRSVGYWWIDELIRD